MFDLIRVAVNGTPAQAQKFYDTLLERANGARVVEDDKTIVIASEEDAQRFLREHGRG